MEVLLPFYYRSPREAPVYGRLEGIEAEGKTGVTD